jgi:heme exporter protein D
MLFIGNPKVNLPIFGPTTLYTLFVGFIALLMTLYFLINTSIQARKLKLLDEKRLERKQEKLKNATENHKTIAPSASNQ